MSLPVWGGDTSVSRSTKWRGCLVPAISGFPSSN